MRDPLHFSRVVLALVILTGGAAVVVAGIWGLGPIDEPVVPSVQTIASEQAIEPGAERVLDLSGFGRTLWPAPQPKPAPPQPAARAAAPPQPPQLELVAIIGRGGDLRAAIYDPKTDALRRLRVGEAIGRFTVSAITPDAVEISDGARLHRLERENDEKGAAVEPNPRGRRPLSGGRRNR